ncbi:MAG: hypothetical protein K2H85_11360, partial [Allobaculum sp.]|nr:hypothetical protein [Allobaculum sp.]
AHNATVHYGPSRDIGIKYRTKANVGAGTTYKSKDFTITYGGKTYPAFCLDPDLSGPSNVTCSPYEGDQGLVWLLQQLKGASSDLQLLTFRMYGVYTDMMKTTSDEHKSMTNAKAAITVFLQIKDGNQAVMRERGTSNPYDILFGNTALIDQAFNLAYQARSMSGGALEESPTGSIKVGQKQVNGLNATYPLTSSAEIKPEYIDFECENCTILNKQWNGTTGTVTVAANQCDKEYNLVIVYKSSTTNAYTCSSSSTSTQSDAKRVQTFFMIADGSEGEVKIPYPDKVACDGEDCCTEDPIEPGWIGGNVNNCCEDGGNSEAHEYDLDKLFCYDKDLHVDYYNPKCKTDYY